MGSVIPLQQRCAGLVLAVTLLLGAACTPVRPPLQPTQQPSVLERAETSARAGNWATAAPLYEEAAVAASGSSVVALSLDAAQAWLLAGQPQRAGQILDKTDTSLHTDQLILRKQVIRAEIALAEGQPERAYSALRNIAYLQADDRLRAQGYRVLGRASLRLNRPLDAARHFARAEPLIHSDEERTDNQLLLAESLQMLSPEVLQRHQSPAGDAVLDGWIELVLLARAINSPQDRQRASQAWRQRYADLSVTSTVWDQLLGGLAEAGVSPTKIALLLPLSGGYATAGRMVLDGFLNSYYESPQRPELAIIDTGEREDRLTDLITELADGGIEIIVGPLRKELARSLVSGTEPRVPILLLNHLDEVQPPAQVFQFGLTPETDGQQAAQLAIASGFRRSVVLRSDEEWAERVATAFSLQFGEHPGTRVLTSRAYDSEATDHGDLLRNVLDLVGSSERHRRLENLLGTTLNNTPRRRQDLDLIFLVAQPRSARLLAPQIRFHYADDVPVIATAHAYTPAADSALNKDLDGIAFCDATSLVAADGTAPGRDPTMSGANARLAALGADAYNLLPYLASLRERQLTRFSGSSGILNVNAAGIVQRTLTCARIRGGVPVALVAEPDPRHQHLAPD